uniref:Carotenoid-cleaving dioxygenase, mitochondrial n=1 Tax=Anolis carolinensis TaxID=28377 RepID=H9GM87_ANOCA
YVIWRLFLVCLLPHPFQFLLRKVILTRSAVACPAFEERRLLASNFHTSPRSQESAAPNQKQERQVTFRHGKGLKCVSSLFSSVEENPKVISTKISGQIPKWLKGKLLRNGPGKFEFGKDKYNHWFDGMALLHQFEIEEEVVKYSSKFLRSDSYVTNSKKNRIMISEFGTMAMPDPCKTIFERFLSKFEMPKITDNCNVNYVVYNGDYFVSTETNFMHKVDLETLETKEKVKGQQRASLSTHGSILHTLTTQPFNAKASLSAHGSILHTLTTQPFNAKASLSAHGSILHTLTTQPFNAKASPSVQGSILRTLTTQPFNAKEALALNGCVVTRERMQAVYGDCVDVSPVRNWASKFKGVEVGTSDLRVKQRVGRPVTATTEFHKQKVDRLIQDRLIQNNCCITRREISSIICISQERVGHIIALLGCRKILSTSSTTDSENLFIVGRNVSNCQSCFLFQIWCTYESLHDEELEKVGGLEFPQINYTHYNGKKYRYFYGCGFGNVVGDSLIKMDLKTKEMKIWQQDEMFPSEPVFVPEPNSGAEDSGVILSVILTPDPNQGSFLLVLDAKSFTELGRAEVPVHIPYGFHGIFAQR